MQRLTTRLAAAIVVFAALVLANLMLAGPALAEKPLTFSPDSIAPAEPDAALAADLLDFSGPVSVVRADGDLPGWRVIGESGDTLGFIGSSWAIARSVGYSGRPVDMLVAVTPQAHIAGARLMRHDEPILTLGLSDADLERFVGQFTGIDLAAPPDAAGEDAPDAISRATVSSGVMRNAILRVGRTLALSHGLLSTDRIDRVSFVPHEWAALREMGAIASTTVTMAEAAEALAAADRPLTPSQAPFVEMHMALLDPPEIGLNILDQQTYTGIMATLPADRVALFVASRGLYSHRGTGWRRSGVFERLEVVQGDRRFPLTDQGYVRLDEIAAGGAPEFRERSVFHLGGEGFDPVAPFRLELTASRPANAGEVEMTIGLDYVLPESMLTPPPPEPEPLWMQTWRDKVYIVAGVATMQVLLTLILLFQEQLVRRKRLWIPLRLGFLAVTLVWLGWIVGGQLSVVQVVAFLQSLLTGFAWETFLVEPVIFTLWAGVALGLLFWGRGVFCGWLCPFGALQELTNAVARRLGVKQIAVPHALHERLWIIKYTLFVAILGLSFYSMTHALILAEVEPFKTAISMHMMRAWPFVAFVLVLLVAGMFIERFYCRYLCPLGAALAIPAKLKIFDWLRRRPQCGRECRLCEPNCPVGAINPLGRINPNECVLCMRCQVILNDPETCPVLKRRARAARAAAT